MTINQKVAIVTGGGSGIGRATAGRLVEDGYRVVVADVNASAANAVANELGDSRAVGVTADVRQESHVIAMVDTAIEAFDRLDVLVNNAGVGGAFGPITELEIEDWDYTFEVLVRGVFLGIKHAAKVIQPQGSIINIASAAAFSGSFGPVAYTAAKSAVVSLTRAAAVELAEGEIRVNAVCPGVIRTPLMSSAKGEPPHAQPLKRWGEPDDIASTIAFLAGPDSRFVTGVALLADGGLVAAGPGPDFSSALGTDSRAAGWVGVNRGTTGEPSQVHRRIE